MKSLIGTFILAGIIITSYFDIRHEWPTMDEWKAQKAPEKRKVMQGPNYYQSYRQISPDLAIEDDAFINLEGSDSVIITLVNLIRGSGYRCDSISVIGKALFSRAFNVTCNEGMYSYKIEDRGGRWHAALD